MRFEKLLGTIGSFISFTIFFVASAMAAPAVNPQELSVPAKVPTVNALPASTVLPELIVKSIQLVPEQPEPGTPFEVHIELFNSGNLPTVQEQKYIVEITPGLFTPDPNPLPSRIAPNQSKLIIKKYTIETAGSYQVLVRLFPGSSNATIKSFNIKSLPKMKPGMIKSFDPQPEPPGVEQKINPQVQPR